MEDRLVDNSYRTESFGRDLFEIAREAPPRR